MYGDIGRCKEVPAARGHLAAEEHESLVTPLLHLGGRVVGARARARLVAVLVGEVLLQPAVRRAWRLAGGGLAPVHLQRPQLVEQARLAPPAEDEHRVPAEAVGRVPGARRRRLA